ncbi:hypothetical protein PUMCH_000018 [Australozyma saopauloensis]|uniref:Trimethylguanosine synthase n=1 Tax=Australozyma saopauloensis TaxID=291208 RepID=A0AAX4H2H5_9ASCO|nr:hypothetical protein PUMCH_000018 [[Candida] saopauloensis]
MSDDEVILEPELLMHTLHTLPKQCKKYWNKRYKIFSKYDEGVFLSSELWYSVTPEITAEATALLVKKLIPDCKNVLDVCCGGGGNTIQFAKLFERVGGVDINPTNVKCSRHNCLIYGVSEKTWFIEGDWLELAKSPKWLPEDLTDGKFDFVFCSPPWGGPNYKHQLTFDLNVMQPFNLRELCNSMMPLAKNFGFFLPRNLDFDQLRQIGWELGFPKTRVVCLRQDSRPMAILAIFGPSFENDI